MYQRNSYICFTSKLSFRFPFHSVFRSIPFSAPRFSNTPCAVPCLYEIDKRRKPVYLCKCRVTVERLKYCRNSNQSCAGNIHYIVLNVIKYTICVLSGFLTIRVKVLHDCTWPCILYSLNSNAQMMKLRFYGKPNAQKICAVYNLQNITRCHGMSTVTKFYIMW